MAATAGPRISTNGLLASFDFLNPLSYPGTGNTVNSEGSLQVTWTLLNSTYYTVDPALGAVTFTRTASVPKDGGSMRLTGTPSGGLAVSSFMYGDHTWEVTFRIDDVTPGGYAGDEQWSMIAGYPGFNSGFVYTASTMRYDLWTTGPTSVTPASWTVGTTGSSQIVQGRWYTIAVTRVGNTWTPYLNGAQSAASQSISVSYSSINNYLTFGAFGNPGAGNGFNLWYSKSTVAATRMYARGLSATEIANNFNATRGRYGI